jgi:hypothetical protein
MMFIASFFRVNLAIPTLRPNDTEKDVPNLFHCILENLHCNRVGKLAASYSGDHEFEFLSGYQLSYVVSLPE